MLCSCLYPCVKWVSEDKLDQRAETLVSVNVITGPDKCAIYIHAWLFLELLFVLIYK